MRMLGAKRCTFVSPLQSVYDGWRQAALADDSFSTLLNETRHNYCAAANETYTYYPNFDGFTQEQIDNYNWTGGGVQTDVISSSKTRRT